MTDAVKERPILFSGEMVRAILDGTKTATRRVVKGPNADIVNSYELRGMQDYPDGSPRAVFDHHTEDPFSVVCPYGKPGDRLWVKETWAAHSMWEKLRAHEITVDDSTCRFYRADGAIGGGCIDCQRGPWRPSIFMPRWASRITLEVTSVRVERLHDITEADAKAEGTHCVDAGLDAWAPYKGAMGSTNGARNAFRYLWESINGTESWAASPWVWVIGFRRVP